MSLEGFHRKAVREEEKEKNLNTKAAIGIAFLAFINACGEDVPHEKTIENFFATHPEAERLSQTTPQDIKDTFAKFKAEIEKSGHTFIDLRKPELLLKYTNMPHFKYMHEAHLLDDATVQIVYIEKDMTKESAEGVDEYETRYTFGPDKIEIKGGSLPSNDPDKSSVRTYHEVHTKTGGITRFYTHDGAKESSFYLASDGIMEYKNYNQEAKTASKLGETYLKRFKELGKSR